MPEPLPKKWDDLLREGILTPPAQFHASVMTRVAHAAQVNQRPEPMRQRRFRFAVQALAVAAAAIAGLVQLALFSLGIWAATAAG